MPIQINNIKVNRGGPLKDDFQFEPGDINLIYGSNETGKTYIVESIIRLLFRTGARAPAGWRLRDWELAGKISVTGLEEKPISFTKTGKKLDDHWNDIGKGLPLDFSKMMVIRAGETYLSEEGDGVGRDILKNYLSGEGMLDTIEDGISSTVQSAVVEHKSIHGNRRGEVKHFQEAQIKLDRIDNLLEDVDRGYIAGAIRALQKERERKEKDLQDLLKARQYHAGLMYRELQKVAEEAAELPDENRCAKIEKQIGIYDVNTSRQQHIEDELKRLEETSDDYSWVEQALQNYQALIGGGAQEKPGTAFLVFGIFSFIVAVIFGFLGQKTGLGIGALATIVFFFFYLARMSEIKSSAYGKSVELEKLEAEFERRFNRTLTDKAAIQSQLKKLEKEHFLAEQHREELAGLNQEISIMSGEITASLQEYTGENALPETWQQAVSAMRKMRISLGSKISDLENRIALLGVKPDQYLEEEPVVKWDSKKHTDLEAAIENIRLKVDDEKEKLASLKSRVAQETGMNSTEQWENLLTAFQEKRENAVNDYKQIAAKILGEMQVYRALQEFRDQETERIKNALEQQALTEPLFSVTGRYSSMDIDGDDLILTDQEDNSFLLADMSTGVREQVFLALRLGFVSISMENDTAFLILDDAFQHSDWIRRKNLVNQVFSLADKGWQIFYFTMDDNIKDLFQSAGKTAGDRFVCLNLD